MHHEVTENSEHKLYMLCAFVVKINNRKVAMFAEENICAPALRSGWLAVNSKIKKGVR
jgi:hypothetical protein